MSMEGHVERLQRDHNALDEQIQEMEARPGADQTEISDLKKRKLRVKDKLEGALSRA